MAADCRDVARLQRAVDGDVLAKHVAAADLDAARVLGHVDVLRHAAEDSALQHDVVTAQDGARFDDGTARKLASVAEHDARLDDRERTDRDVRTKLGMRADNGKRMNRHGGLPLVADANGDVQRRGTAARVLSGWQQWPMTADLPNASLVIGMVPRIGLD
jgi:hypothetical protein